MARKKIALAGLLVGLIVAVLACLLLRDPLNASARRAWKDKAVASIRQRVDDAPWL